MKNKPLENRFKRLEGQLRKLREDIASDKQCTDVVPQFLAVKGAVESAFEAYLKESLDSCAGNDQEQLKALIAVLAKA